MYHHYFTHELPSGMLRRMISPLKRTLAVTLTLISFLFTTLDGVTYAAADASERHPYQKDAGVEVAVDPAHQAIEAAVARVKPSLVRIQVVATQYYQGREVKYEASGSGVIITKEGHVITNHHVAGHATRIVCILPDNEEVEAELVGTDALADISVLKLKSDGKREFVTGRVRRLQSPTGGRLGAGDGQSAGDVAIGDAGHRQQHEDGHAGSVFLGAVHAGRRGRGIARALDRA